MNLRIAPQLNRKVWNILAGTFFTRTALFMSVPYLSIFLTGQKHIPLLLTSLILAVNPLAGVAFSWLGGALADKLPLHRIILYTPLIWGTVFILFYFADSFPFFLLLNALNGLCYSLFEPASKKVLSTESLPEHRLLVFNLRYTAINLGCFAGPLLSLLFNMKMTLFPYVILGIMYILYGASTMLFFHETSSNKVNIHYEMSCSLLAIATIRKDHVYLLLLAGMSFSYFGYSQLNGTVSQFLSNTAMLADGTRLYSILLSANAIVILAAQFAVLRLISTWNPFTVVLLSNLLIGLSFLFFLFPAAYPPLLLFITVFSLGELLIGARFDALVDELSSADNKGLYFGCAEIVKLGTISGPIAGSGLLGMFGFQAAWPVFGLLSGITLTGALLIRAARIKHRLAVPPSLQHKKRPPVMTGAPSIR
ncbi:Na(+), Li(+), K(+)/H(+) antiporter [Paenibacillus auburnensis]|uniref:Na(+), Li(+), K(+)/H(+) antiporter n=1 Tax=Paenibacillus auburnensis TaxID=2905649 RepID=A0ABN8GY47_9BACL|nr:MFS transporter [Paenibacillus auburnensis]CAH1221905.1 Na(+), Li(+), K(+)/H(+) antiporter [Paenibacillus auburnensis]